MTDHAAQEKLHRSIGALSVDIPKAREEREAELFQSAGQMAQHIPTDIKGKVGRRATTTTLRLKFPLPFVQIDRQLAGALDTPTPNYGNEMKTNAVVIIQPQVMEWVRDDRDFITGAVVRVVAWAPDAPKNASFEATVHFTFYGYGAEDEDESQG